MDYRIDLSTPPKSLRESLCVAQSALAMYPAKPEERARISGHLGEIINQLDLHRPLGVDGKHGDRHTATCGCDVFAGDTRTGE
jgi:hypothetical protein